MNTNYHFSERGNAKVLFVDQLFNELENKQIITSVSELIENGQINFIIDLSKVPYINMIADSTVCCPFNTRPKKSEASFHFQVSLLR
ncbi:hypothetical protein MASR1M65_23060 [Saprospiraceae bacterium]